MSVPTFVPGSSTITSNADTFLQDSLESLKRENLEENSRFNPHATTTHSSFIYTCVYTADGSEVVDEPYAVDTLVRCTFGFVAMAST